MENRFQGENRGQKSIAVIEVKTKEDLEWGLSSGDGKKNQIWDISGFQRKKND